MYNLSFSDLVYLRKRTVLLLKCICLYFFCGTKRNGYGTGFLLKYRGFQSPVPFVPLKLNFFF
jgi:hypothetical protein